MNMKSLRGWFCLIVFVVACVVIGYNRYLMKYQNATVLTMLAISVGLVLVLNYGKGEAEKEKVEIEDEV